MKGRTDSASTGCQARPYCSTTACIQCCSSASGKFDSTREKAPSGAPSLAATQATLDESSPPDSATQAVP